MSIASVAPAASSILPATGAALPRRLAALIIDILALTVLEAVVNGVFGVTRVTSGFAPAMTSGAFAVFTTQTVVDWPWLTLLLTGYFGALEGLFGATLGKALAGLRVTDLEGRRVSWRAALIRNLIRPLDMLPLAYLLGGTLVLASRTHQRLGDRLAGSVVVPRSVATSAPLDRSAVRRRSLGLATTIVILTAFCAWFDYFGRPPLVIESARNTGDFIFRQPVSNLELGSGRFAGGSVSYPISYRIASTDQTCSGEVRLRWIWAEGGWFPSDAVVTCSPRVYP
jgi:uncharacterized RDD family membrane protein YckC